MIDTERLHRPLDEEGRIFDDDDSDLAATREFDKAAAAGADALAKNDPQGARALLERALKLKPRNQRARNLMGLALFKLGELERAESLYKGLIDDHPADPTLRVNLGLVFLKAGASTDAVRCFETALDLQPGHAKAQNYLGLALAQKGEHAKAKEWFDRCGNTAMAERMKALLAASPIREVAGAAEERLDQPQPFQSALESVPPPAPTASGWMATQPAEAVAPPPPPPDAVAVPLARVALDRPAEASPLAQAIVAETQKARTVVPGATPAALADFTAQRRLSVPVGEGGFSIGDSELIVHVRGEMLTRLDGLVASWGSVRLSPELKRFRGRATDKPFGEGARRMLRASGEGRFVLSREGRTFTALELGDEAAYFREETLFAFEESLLFENGRVPGKDGHDLHLVHLRGRGRLLLVTAGAPRSADVLRDEPLRIPMDQLVGWHGPLIQPRLVPIVEDAPELGVALELSGEGRALVDTP